ncbi:hypothetical protein GGP55_001339 [Salinibacter ruber]|uniref:Uncharacterized protein n=1 Tax=Salinibacter ruber TaxID=146919 RepID=A0A9X2ZVA4_9BACT|nr:hypothetical protein [Salinibacter ruber]MCS3640678.1 hypothetical protein [Salinibacter ruber]MCS3658069.1 hypothetical protein [Salinibacter ruber]MCS3665297.1 hypothetical protein [Salinibacter ruber]MCS3678711.1 hypothetical protein [Salinibacter ruber]
MSASLVAGAGGFVDGIWMDYVWMGCTWMDEIYV